MNRIALRILLIALTVPAIAGLAPQQLCAQSASLFQDDIPSAQGKPLTLANSSWLYQKVEPPKEITLHSIITVVVEEKNQMISKGEVQRRRTAQYDAKLQDWLKFKGLNVQLSTPASGDPEANGQLNVQNQAQMQLQTNDALLFRIGAEVVDIRPNGTFVIEAHHKIHDNDELWEATLTGIVRREDVLPNNTVMSENIAELMIFKQELGHVRDGYKRGWFSYWFDRFSPF